jgi:hypothetical protein
MIQEQEVRDRLAAFLRNDISLEDFKSWLAAHSWNMHRDSPAAARELVGRIDLLLAEHLSGYRSEAEVRSLFQRWARPHVIAIELTAPGVDLIGSNAPRLVSTTTTATAATYCPVFELGLATL